MPSDHVSPGQRNDESQQALEAAWQTLRQSQGAIARSHALLDEALERNPELRERLDRNKRANPAVESLYAYPINQDESEGI